MNQSCKFNAPANAIVNICVKNCLLTQKHNDKKSGNWFTRKKAENGEGTPYLVWRPRHTEAKDG